MTFYQGLDLEYIQASFKSLGLEAKGLEVQSP